MLPSESPAARILLFGLKLTQNIDVSPRVHLQEPVSASHSRTVLSLLPEAMAFPSAEKVTKLLQTVDRRQETPRAVPRPPQPPFGRSSSAFHSGRLTHQLIQNWKPFQVLQQTLAVSRRAEQLRLERTTSVFPLKRERKKLLRHQEEVRWKKRVFLQVSLTSLLSLS